jgi:hypothetical protein
MPLKISKAVLPAVRKPIKSVAPMVDPSVESAIAFAEAIARSYISAGGNLADLFAAFAGMVVSEDRAIGLRCLTAADSWVSKDNFLSSNDERPALLLKRSRLHEAGYTLTACHLHL